MRCLLFSALDVFLITLNHLWERSRGGIADEAGGRGAGEVGARPGCVDEKGGKSVALPDRYVGSL